MDEKSIHSEPVPLGDATYPVYAVDSYGPNRLLLSSSMLFNDVLDVQVVKSSLERLIQIGDWRKLGGRLQEKVNPIHFVPCDAGSNGCCCSTRERWKYACPTNSQTPSQHLHSHTIHTIFASPLIPKESCTLARQAALLPSASTMPLLARCSVPRGSPRTLQS